MLGKTPSIGHAACTTPQTVAFHWASCGNSGKPTGYSKVDWHRAPLHAHWWAIDANGNAHWFANPRLPVFDTSWHFEVTLAPDFGFHGDYRESLTERPLT